MTRQEKQTLAERIRRAIQESGLSLNELGKRAGLDHSRLSRFLRGERDLTLNAANQLCEVLGLMLAGSQEPVLDSAADRSARPPKAMPGTPPAEDLEATERMPKQPGLSQRMVEEARAEAAKKPSRPPPLGPNAATKGAGEKKTRRRTGK